jgi:hypothetical protein
MSVIRDAILLVLLAAGIGLAANALRPSGRIAMVAREPHEILKPCPEAGGRVEPIEAASLSVSEPGLLLLDGRAADAFAAWHAHGARSLPFDYLEPVSREAVAKLLTLRPRRVVVYGDGENPESGEQLAKQIAGQGLKNVFFVRGGAPALHRLSQSGEGRSAATKGGR